MKGEDGYTIIEALAAMSILAVSLVALYGAGADVLNATDRVAAHNRALLFTQSKLEVLAITSAPLPAHDRGYEKDLSWTIITRDASSREIWSHLVLQEVELTVGWNDGHHHRSITIVTRHLGRTAP
ncbi:type IV pilus modification PilV family protein [Rhizomicrobium electricum]|uniref:General secretion pathway protein I n=1 Tax=Rhizomicrobium electricum TaxID=480070 RepID=A0ABN1ENT2_9PROT|nr:prepilin-type N-terminal cleavage/methylation domain-containing protein [Rhizomicrobium electricum]NIJ48767.1 Tfp pilus assembly protein PilV [Rhizomicrobium electricum]